MLAAPAFSSEAQTTELNVGKPFVYDFSDAVLKDQRSIFTSPLRLKKHDLEWLVPLSGAAGYLIASDRRNMDERIHTNISAQETSAHVADAGLFALAAVPAAVGWWGWRHDDSYAKATLMLSARAALDSLLAAEVIDLATRRVRPLDGDKAGDFFQTNPGAGSFPSRHAALAWSVASVVAHRYPGWLTQMSAYGLATAVSLSRITARQHFPADVVVGSSLGFLVGDYVSRQDHTRRLFEPLVAAPDVIAPPVREAASDTSGSTFVVMDSWVYPALDRLAALGLIPTQISGLRPWTRSECRRQMLEAEANLELQERRLGSGVVAEARQFLNALSAEFSEEPLRPAAVLDSLYFTTGLLSGRALDDSFHFGQTWSNDFGRPFGRGWNSDAGFILRAESGRFFGLVRGEYQYAPGSAAYPLQTRQLIASLDGNPLQPGIATADTSRFRVLEAYAGVRLGDFNLSVGKQSLYWGPTFDAPLSFSNNAEPTKNAKISTIHPIRLPGVLRHLGELRGEFVIGKLGGQQYTWRPWFNAQTISLKLTDNLELGFTRWSIFWGIGHPITLGTFWRNLTSFSSAPHGMSATFIDPGDRKAGFDFKYRVPGLRNWLTLYSDSYSDDDPSPLAAPRRAAINPGIYLTHLPGLARLDLRVEAPMTRPFDGDQGGSFNYYNDEYHSGNTNYGYLLGNSIGRDARAVEAWSRYWFSTRNWIEAGYRQVKTGTNFLPGGGTQTDVMLKGSFSLARNTWAETTMQCERFFIPPLGGPRHNLSASLGIVWQPNLVISK
jgi:membrane-associated phospholipid phosphatase